MPDLAGIDSFFVGGRSVVLSGLPVAARRMAMGAVPRPVDPNGTYVTGQMYVQRLRQRPPRHPFPVLLWHGGGHTSACWETTPDGRPGWLAWFLARGFDVLVSDAVERGRAGFRPSGELTSADPKARATDAALQVDAPGTAFPIRSRLHLWALPSKAPSDDSQPLSCRACNRLQDVDTGPVPKASDDRSRKPRSG